ncbi:hypothetical protein GYH30_002108 [Glycine max]|uniref:Uncharacterized protein n=1 Tax=Glycine max TaxID=3847 RepID=A0A0R0LDV3_SOYBN|nr:hypothetical protein GYH30_002108 [Glycine max]
MCRGSERLEGSPVRERNFSRPDHLRHFKDYNGDFDVRNKHYVASAAFTGVHGYAFACVRLLCRLALAISIIVKCLCSGSASLPCLDNYYLHISFLLLFFTSLAIQKTLRRTEKLKECVEGIGEDALRTIGRVMKTTNQMQILLLPYNPQICVSLNSTTQDLRNNSRVIRRLIDRSGQSFDKATHTSYVFPLNNFNFMPIVCSAFVVLTVNLVTLVAALVLMLLHWRPGFIIFAEDACFAFEDFLENRQNSCLGSMLPCIDESFSGKLIAQIGYTIHSFIVELNSNMSVIYRLLGASEENEELMGVIKICDPFSGSPNLSYVPHSCPQDAIWIGDLSKIHPGFAGDMYPDLQRLSKCTAVKNKVAEIVSQQCRPIRISTTLLWSSMLSLSIIMFFRFQPNNWHSMQIARQKSENNVNR